MTGLVAFVATLLFSSSAHAASGGSSASSAPLCDFRGASVMVRAPEQTASVEPTDTSDHGSDKGSNVAALCDTRGATMIAPAPQLQSETTWLTLTPGSAADVLTALMARSVTPGQQPLAFVMELPDPGAISAVPCVAPAGETARIPCPAAEDHTHDGVKSSLERPPRA